MNQQNSHQEAIEFNVLRRLHDAPDLSQRTLSKELGISLGSVNYCFKALADKGWVKMQNFGQSQHKLGYAYLLTPSGIAEKARLTAVFLKRKMIEYDKLSVEIDALKSEVAQSEAAAEIKIENKHGS